MSLRRAAPGSLHRLDRLALLALVLAAFGGGVPVRLRSDDRADRTYHFTSTVFRTCWPLPTNAALISGPKARP